MSSIEKSSETRRSTAQNPGNERKHLFSTRDELLKAAIEMSTWNKINLLEIVTKPGIPLNELTCISPQSCFAQHKLVA